MLLLLFLLLLLLLLLLPMLPMLRLARLARLARLTRLAALRRRMECPRTAQRTGWRCRATIRPLGKPCLGQAAARIPSCGGRASSTTAIAPGGA